MKRVGSVCTVCGFRWREPQQVHCPNCLAPPIQVGPILKPEIGDFLRPDDDPLYQRIRREDNGK